MAKLQYKIAGRETHNHIGRKDILDGGKEREGDREWIGWITLAHTQDSNRDLSVTQLSGNHYNNVRRSDTAKHNISRR